MEKFEDVAYGTKHVKIREQYGAANHCELNKEHKSNVFDWANINHQYNKNIDEWLPLCHKCHNNFDWGNIDIEILKTAIKNREPLEEIK